jgi:hypothetical protein
MHFILHARVFAAHWTMHHVNVRLLSDLACCADPYRAVDDCQCGIEVLDVPNGLADEVPNLEGVANVHHIDVLSLLRRKGNVHSNDVMMLRKDGPERFPNLSESDYQHVFLVIHGYCLLLVFSSRYCHLDHPLA